MSQQTPQSEHLDLQNDLDQSIQQQDSPSEYKRDSGIEQLNFQSEEYHHSPHQDMVEHAGQFMRDSQFSEEGVFSYNDDYRMRQSMKSEEDFQLEDLSGKADMTDRKVQKEQQNNQASQGINIVEKYDEKINHQVIDQTVKDQTIDQQLTEKTLHLQAKEQQQLPKPLEHQQPQQKSQTQQSNVLVSNQPIYNLPPKQSLQFTESLQKQPQIPSTNVTEQLKQPVSTPKKQPTNPSSPTAQQKQQWSNISNNSATSPKQDLQNHQSPQQFKLQHSPQVSVPDLKQNSPLFLVKQPMVSINQSKPSESLGSSIKDWFKTSSFKSEEQKQYNPTQNEQPSPVKKETAQEKYRREMAAEMAGFQQNLTQHQKSNKLYGNTSQKQKQKLKVNKTHLPQPTSKKSQTPSQQMGTQQYRMLLKISFQKKKQNYQMLKQWDKRRAQNMSLHKNVIQLLQNEIDKRIKASLQNFEIYTNFFKEKLKQEEKFINSPVINTKYALQNNAISKNIYINCSVILNSLSQENYAKCKKVQDFITMIKNSVLKDLMEQHLNESQRQLLKVREKISTLKNSLKKYNSETEEKSQELAKLFSESSNNVSIKSSHDFYSVQLDFLRSASQQILIQKRLGQNCLEYYHTALNEEFKRAKVIRQALVTYSKALKETYNIELEDVGLEQLSKSEETNLIKEFYSLDDMFDERSSQMLKEKFKISQQQDLSINHISKYVETFQFENFNNRMLLLKEFNAKYFSAGGSKDSKANRQETCYMVITVDFYIHLFFSCEKSSMNFKPDVSLKIIAKELDIRPQKEEFIDIVKKQEKRASMISYFWDSKNEKAYRIKLGSKDAKEEFCDYVKKLMF